MLFLFSIQDRAYGFTVCVVSAENEDMARNLLNIEHPVALTSPVDLVDRGQRIVSMEYDE